MPRTKRAAMAAACAFGVAAAMTATAEPAAAAGHAADYTCYANYPVNGTTAPTWTFHRGVGGSLVISTSLITSVWLDSTNSTASLFWGPTPTITGMRPFNGVGAPVDLDKPSAPTLSSAPQRIDITWIQWGTVTSCYLVPGSATGFPI